MAHLVGTLLPLSSLWSEDGSDVWTCARAYIDWLHETGQSIWQMLPLYPTTYHRERDYLTSPYTSHGIGIDPYYLPPAQDVDSDAYEQFVTASSWLTGYAVYLALCRQYQTDDWRRWDSHFVTPSDDSIDHWTRSFTASVDTIKREQYSLHAELLSLRSYAHARGVQLWGDLPFFVSLSGYWCWRYPQAFELSDDYDLEYVAGSISGRHWHERQVWGFPLYRYTHPDAERVWDERMRHVLTYFDRVRIDSASRLYEYEMFHTSDSTRDHIAKGPGDRYLTRFHTVAGELGSSLYIEDVSYLDMTQLKATAHRLSIPGVSAITMMFAKQSPHIHQDDFRLFDGGDHVYFSSTHDSPPLAAYLATLTPAQLTTLAQALGIPHVSDARSVIESLIARSPVTIVQMQDWLGSSMRTNTPGTISESNWNYRTEVPVERLPRDIMDHTRI